MRLPNSNPQTDTHTDTEQDPDADTDAQHTRTHGRARAHTHTHKHTHTHTHMGERVERERERETDTHIHKMNKRTCSHATQVLACKLNRPQKTKDLMDTLDAVPMGEICVAGKYDERIRFTQNRGCRLP